MARLLSTLRPTSGRRETGFVKMRFFFMSPNFLLFLFVMTVESLNSFQPISRLLSMANALARIDSLFLTWCFSLVSFAVRPTWYRKLFN